MVTAGTRQVDSGVEDAAARELARLAAASGARFDAPRADADGSQSPPSDEPAEPVLDPAHDPAAIAFAQHLRELGAETETERRVKRIVPWFSSLFLHAGLVVLGFVAVTAVQYIREEEPILVVADFNAPNYQPLASGEMNQASTDQATLQDRMRTESIGHAIEERLNDLEIDPLVLLSDAASRTNLAEFSPQPRQGTARFVGLTGSNARRVLYIVDGSGSMIGTLQIIIEELARSIEALTPQQEFGVIFFQSNEFLIVPPEDRLIRAVNDEKIRALTWVRQRVIPEGRSNPIEAIRKGLSLEPDVIFLLSNNITGSGVFEIDQSDLLALLNELNPIDEETGRRRTQIQCIQFLDPDPLDTLRKIAEQHGGPNGYKFLDRRELGIGVDQ